MLCGNAIAGVSVTLSYVFKELECASLSRTTSKKLTTRLQREPRQDGDIPRVRRVALRGVPSARSRCSAPLTDARHQSNEVRSTVPGLNLTHDQASVTGIIAIPGMMSGAILGGADVLQAARLQMVIMFMITASCALACIIATLLALSVCVDSEHRIRSERIDSRHHAVRRASSAAVGAVAGAVQRAWIRFAGLWKHPPACDDGDGSGGERAPLLG
jgi:hypothetical protein